MRKLVPYLIGLTLIPLIVTAARDALGREQAWDELPMLYVVVVGTFIVTLAVGRLLKPKPPKTR